MVLLAALPGWVSAVPIVAVDTSNNRLSFDSATPATVGTAPISGLGAGENIVGIDFRPANRLLYALTKDGGNVGRIYTLNPTTAVATLVSTLDVALNGAFFGVDFNPVSDRLRVVSDADQNLRINVDTGATLVDGTLAYAAGDPNAAQNPTIVGAAYTNSFPPSPRATPGTSLYTIDSNLNILNLQAPPNNGTQTTVGPLGGNTDENTSFDIEPGPSNRAFAIVRNAGTSIFVSVNLTTGAASSLGNVGGNPVIAGMAIVPPTFVVNSNVDPGAGVCDTAECTLREAIAAANAEPDFNVITFNIPGGGVQTISIMSSLNAISSPAIIDGSTQPGYTTTPLIELNGAGAGAGVNGLIITAGSSTLRALAINRFGADGIQIGVNGGNVIEGCFIGTDPTGTFDQGNAARGVLIFNSANNLVGGTTPGARNLISANSTNGVEILSNLATGNRVQGNLIGTDVTGTLDLGNTANGVAILGALNNRIGGDTPNAGNLISGNSANGVLINMSSATGNVVQGNRIGTDLSGNAAVPNGTGVRIADAPNNIIGGTIPDAGNVISGNAIGVLFSGPPATNNQVQGNLIGTNFAGTAALGNSIAGVDIGTNAPNNLIGGTTPGAGNVISGSSAGIGVRISAGGSTGNLVQGNFIGTDRSGTLDLGNDYGVQLSNTSSNFIGGSVEGAGNSIAYNDLAGISQFDGSGNQYFGNGIYRNDGLGIDLLPLSGTPGVTPNDFNDPDTGPNGFQNFPVLTGISTSGGSSSVEGTLNSNANTQYAIQFFSSAEPDPSGYGEGEVFLGYITVTTDFLGNASFSFALPASPTVRFITALATASNDDTSEFSQALEAAPTGPGATPTPTPSPGATPTPTPTATPTPAAQLRNISTRLRVETGDSQGIAGFIITGTLPKRVLIRGLGPSLSQFFVTDVLADPILSLHGGSGEQLMTNNNWRDTQEAAIKATTLPPLDDLESAIVSTLPVGSYSAVVGGTGGSSGVALIEVYDLDANTDGSQLANISTRGFVRTGSNVVIGGFILRQGDPSDVILRGIGPSLASAGVSNALSDPTLELRNGDGALLISNDNWTDDPVQAALITASGLPPQDADEAAIAATLPPGGYTVILSGKNGEIGIGLVEIYKTQ